MTTFSLQTLHGGWKKTFVNNAPRLHPNGRGPAKFIEFIHRFHMIVLKPSYYSCNDYKGCLTSLRQSEIHSAGISVKVGNNYLILVGTACGYHLGQNNIFHSSGI
jgi:hypothetical protein